jgi:TPR repeat protein
VVANAVQRWYAETLAAAKGGEPQAMELLSQMLGEGYGCPRDAALARFWHAAAHARGARRLEGVFDRLP